MSPAATVRGWGKYLLTLVVMAFPLTGEWRRIGGTAYEGPYPGPAGGSVQRVWYSADGSRLYASMPSGRVFETGDFESWTLSTGSAASSPEPLEPIGTARAPEVGGRLRVGSRVRRPEMYAFGRFVHRSRDEGQNWENMTGFEGASILGEGLADLAVSPSDSDEIVVAGRTGVWRSLDGGLTWVGLNDGLPNLPAVKLLTPPGPRALARVRFSDSGEAVWTRNAWVQQEPLGSKVEENARRALVERLGFEVTAVAATADSIYAGGIGGRLWVSQDNGRNWQGYTMAEGGQVESIFVLGGSGRLAFATLRSAGSGARVVRTVNGGLFWDNVTANLPPGFVHGVVADIETGAVYAASDAGLFLTYADMTSAGPATEWVAIPEELPKAPVLDVKLDLGGNQLYALVEGYGLFATLAPHRRRAPRVVNAADGSVRAAAPGTLLSVLGSQVTAARAGNLEAPVLGAAGGESQVQVPFEVTGNSLVLAVAANGSGRNFPMPLRPTSPAIFVDRDGTPMLIDADRGVLLDPGVPARAGGRVQILATGLGKVTPDWPTGLAAPAESIPKVVAPVRAYLDRQPLEVLKATLAPGYVGFYLVEVQLPDAVMVGSAELYIEADGEPSGRVSLLLAQ